MTFDIKYWLKLSLSSLLIVSLLGVLMRYKIGFDFPHFDQKNIQHAHSHFAFAGWVTQILFVLMIHFLQNKLPTVYLKQYKIIVAANLICAYAMLISFFISGYSAFSITFSTLSIVISCFFAYFFFKDLKKLDANNPSKPWFKAALWFNIFSSLGTFYLAYIMMSKNFHENTYLAAIYFYLHFQYNGFFIFACMGLAINEAIRLLPAYKYHKIIFQLFFAAAIPAYFLSILWASIPIWLYIIIVIAAFVQVIAWFIFFWDFFRSLSDKTHLGGLVRYLYLFVCIAFSVKLLLQLGSTIPIISKMAFGFRPIIIAYLHLVLLAVISVFLLSYSYSLKLIQHSKLTTIALILFSIGVFANELVLAIQGVASFGYVSFPYMNESLFVIAVFIAISLILLMASQLRKDNDLSLK